MNRKKQLNHFLLCFLLLSCTLMANGNKTQAQPDINDFTAGMVVSWNERVMAAAVAEDGLLTLKGVRTLSMLHVAMHDALNAIHPVYTGYAYKGKMMDASPVAAATQAAFRVAADQYPGEQHQWAEELDQWLNTVEDSPAKTKGITLGEAAAMAILEDVFGDDYAFTMTTREVDSAGPFSGKVRMDPPTRSFAGFMEAAMEASLSRVYLGIHFRYDSEEGFRLGSQVGNYALDHFLKPGN